MARENEERMDSRFDRGADMARRWADTMHAIVGRVRPYEPVEFYRQTQEGIGTVANPDGSITFSAQSARWTSLVGERMLNAHYPGQHPEPTRNDTEYVRYTVSRFARVYGDTLLPRDPDLSVPLRVLDRGLRANIDVPRMIRDARLEQAFPQINNLGDQYPLYQGVLDTLTDRLSDRLEMTSDELGLLLRRTPPAERFEVLADTLIEGDRLQRRLPDGSARTLPADHVSALKARLVHELASTFMEGAEQAVWDGTDTRSAGNRLGARAAQNLFTELDRSSHDIVTGQRGYAQVSALMATVESRLSTGEADHWNGQLHAATLPSDMLGYAGPDRALTFDTERVIDVLADADPAEPPTPEVRAAVDAVASQAAGLCNPSTPGAAPAGAAAQAFDAQLRHDFVNHERADLYAAVGFTDPPRDAVPESGQTATAGVMAALTKKAGQQLHLDPHQITAELLTTPPDERFAKAAALSLGYQGKVVDHGQLGSATTELAGRIQTAFAAAQEADRTGRTKLHAWSRATAGRALSQQLTRSIDKARKPIERAGTTTDQAIRAATTGQALPGTRVNGAAASAQSAYQPDNARSGQGISGRG